MFISYFLYSAHTASLFWFYFFIGNLVQCSKHVQLKCHDTLGDAVPINYCIAYTDNNSSCIVSQGIVPVLFLHKLATAVGHTKAESNLLDLMALSRLL